MLHLERLSVDFRSFEPRLRDLKLREEIADEVEKLLAVKESKIVELEEGNNEIFQEIRAMKQEMDLLVTEKQLGKAKISELSSKVEDLQTDLQQVNFEKNRLKDTVTNDKEFVNLR